MQKKGLIILIDKYNKMRVIGILIIQIKMIIDTKIFLIYEINLFSIMNCIIFL